MLYKSSYTVVFIQKNGRLNLDLWQVLALKYQLILSSIYYTSTAWLFSLSGLVQIPWLLLTFLNTPPQVGVEIDGTQLVKEIMKLCSTSALVNMSVGCWPVDTWNIWIMPLWSFFRSRWQSISIFIVRSWNTRF